MPVVEGMDFNEVASIRYAEVVLNKAEAQACAGDAGAVETMRRFWKHGTQLYRPYLPAGRV